jgi:hypothetical protein
LESLKTDSEIAPPVATAGRENRSGELRISPSQIADYADTAGAMRRFAASANYAEPGDPAKLARAILQVVDADDPPMRMPFGSDTVGRVETTNAFVAEELARWRGLAVSTDAEN